ncbi:MAG: ankyrin repeat domain-containing protein [Alphaproteobacteria bacterium]
MWLFKSKEQKKQSQDELMVDHYNQQDAERAPMSSELNARLLKALRENMPMTAQQALEKGASPEVRFEGRYQGDQDNGMPVLAYAVKYNNEFIAAALLKHGANANREMGYGCLMDYAVHHGNSRMVRLLLDYGVDPKSHAKDQHWQRHPYEIAKQKCYTDIVRMIEQEPARRAAAAAEAARKKEEAAQAAASAQAEAERAENAAEVTERITVSKPLTLKNARPAKRRMLGFGS